VRKATPKSALRIDTHFADRIRAVWKKFSGKKPDEVGAHRLAAVAFASLEENLSAFEALRAPFPSVGLKSEPRNAVEIWLSLFLRYPDFTLKIMQTARAALRKYDALDRVLFVLSHEKRLGMISDGDLILKVREVQRALGEMKLVSDDTITKRRQRWVAAQTRLDKKVQDSSR